METVTITIMTLLGVALVIVASVRTFTGHTDSDKALQIAAFCYQVAIVLVALVAPGIHPIVAAIAGVGVVWCIRLVLWKPKPHRSAAEADV